MIDTQYEELGHRIINEGVWVPNERTGIACKTVIGHTMAWDLSTGHYPVVTTRPAPIRLPVAELIGYIRAYDNAADFDHRHTYDPIVYPFAP